MQVSWVCFFPISLGPFFCVREAVVPEVVPAAGGERPRTSQKYECWYYWGTVPTPETTHLQTPVNTYTHKLRKPPSLRHRYLWVWLLEAEHNFNKCEMDGCKIVFLGHLGMVGDFLVASNGGCYWYLISRGWQCIGQPSIQRTIQSKYQ